MTAEGPGTNEGAGAGREAEVVGCVGKVERVCGEICCVCVEEFGLYCQVPSPHLGDPARGEPLDWTDGKDLGRSTGSYGSRREDGGVRILGLGLNPEVVPTRSSWPRERN